MEVTFHNQQEIPDEEIKFAVIAASFQGKWIFCRHRERRTWECPGGHREAGENIDETARRELWEETGTVKASITAVCVYKVWNYGMLYFAEVEELEAIPEASEIKEILLSDTLPAELTYAGIHDKLFETAKAYALTNGLLML